MKKKKKEDSIELWSCNFECAGSPLVAVFCIVKEPMYLVKNEDYKEEDKLDYDVYVRPSQVLSKEEVRNCEERSVDLGMRQFRSSLDCASSSSSLDIDATITATQF